MITTRSLGSVGIGLLIAAMSGSAFAAFMPVLDEFWIVKNSAEIFRDSFTNGAVPPSGPDDGLFNPTTYTLVGAGGFTSESGGKLTMTPASGDPIGISGTYSEYSSVAVRQLAFNPANSNFLGQDSSSEIHGLFDLSALPMITGQSFGIRATDRALAIGHVGNETYSLFVGVGADGSPNAGEVVVGLRLNDYEVDWSTVLAAISIESLLPSADQIELIFSKVADADVLTASYSLYDAGNVFASGSIAGSNPLSIYDGELYIRGGFHSTDLVPIPEPATLALLSLGFAGMTFMRKRKATS